MLVKTTGLATGVAISGSATVTSTNAASHATTLGSIGVIVIQSGNGTKAVAAPGIALVSTKKPLSDGQGLDHPDPAHQEDQGDKKVANRAEAWPWPSPWPAPPRSAHHRWR